MIGNRDHSVRKLIGGVLRGKRKQIGSRGIRTVLNALVRGPDMSATGIRNSHNNEDVQNEPKFDHTKPAKSGNVTLEK